jgi:hypothetical protein
MVWEESSSKNLFVMVTFISFVVRVGNPQTLLFHRGADWQSALPLFLVQISIPHYNSNLE